MKIAKLPVCLAVTLKISQGVVEPHLMSLQKAIEFVASLQAEKLAQLRLGEPARLEFFQSKSFEGAAGEIAPCGGERWATSLGIWRVSSMAEV